MDVRNTNNEYLAGYEQGADEWAYYAGIFGEENFPAHGFKKLRNYTTTIRNEGNILLKDGGRGIYGSALFGELKAINGGTISVGDGEIFDESNLFASSGIWLTNFANDGIADLYAKNEAGGIIVTGDLGLGMLARNWYGNKVTLINEGSITVGNGAIGTDYMWNEANTAEVPYDRLFVSIGMPGSPAGRSIPMSPCATAGI